MLWAIVPQVARRPFHVRPATDVDACPFFPLARQKPARTDLLGCSPMRRAVQSAHGFHIISFFIRRAKPVSRLHGFRPADEERYYVKPHERGADGATAD